MNDMRVSVVQRRHSIIAVHVLDSGGSRRGHTRVAVMVTVVVRGYSRERMSMHGPSVPGCDVYPVGMGTGSAVVHGISANLDFLHRIVHPLYRRYLYVYV
jgi:hypothetical protein